MTFSLLIRLAALLCVLPFAAAACASNPFAESSDARFGAPRFDRITIAGLREAVDMQIIRYRQRLDSIYAVQPAEATFGNTIARLHAADRELMDLGRIVNTLATCIGADSLVRLSLEVKPLLIDRHVVYDPRLFAQIKILYDKRTELGLDSMQQCVLSGYYRRYERMSRRTPAQRQRMTQIDKELATKSTLFGHKSKFAAQQGTLFTSVTTSLPRNFTSATASFALRAQKLGRFDAWGIDLTSNNYGLIMNLSTDRELRQRLYAAYTARCSSGGMADNRLLTAEILNLRLEKAKLMGYETYAEYTLANSAIGGTEQAYELLLPVTRAARDKYKAELAELTAFATQIEGRPLQVEPWDRLYYTTKLRDKQIGRELNNLSNYMLIDSVFSGLFYIAEQLYGITSTQVLGVPLFAPEVRVFELREADGRPLGVVYFDLFTRRGKRQGAWTYQLRYRTHTPQREELPLVVVACNFPTPAQGTPTRLSQQRVSTLFHEFGHVLAAVCPDGNYPEFTARLPRDMSELPSQLLEKWVWEPSILKRYARHYQTGNPIPYALIDKINASELFGKGFILCSNCAMALLDLELHSIRTPITPEGVDSIERCVQRRYELPDEAMTKAACFNHLFEGGYAAQFYSYLLGEVLATDAYQAFIQTGNLLDSATAARFRHYVLSRIGMDKAMKQYIRFRGSKPEPAALMMRYGLSDPQAQQAVPQAPIDSVQTL